MEFNTGAIIIEGHVQGLSNTRAIGEAGYPVYVIDKGNCLARYSRYCKKYYRCPDYDSDELADFLVGLAKKENLSGWVLLPSNDHAVLTLSRNRERLLDHFRFTIPGTDVIMNIYDKSKLLRLAAECRVPIPNTYYLNSADADISSLSYPILTKGKMGLSFYQATGKKVHLAQNKQELKSQIENISKVYPVENLFHQELIPFDGKNKTVSFTAFCIEGQIKTHWIGVKLREHPIRFGTATFAWSIECHELLKPSQKIMERLKFTGVCEIEYLKDPRDGQYKLIEINARTWLWVGLARACGVDFAKIAFHYLTGKDEEYPEDYVKGISWLNYLTDTIFAMKAIQKKQLTLKAYLESMKGRKVHAIWSSNDIRPGIMFLFLALYIAVNR